MAAWDVAVQYLELTGVSQYIRWLPLVFVQAEAEV